MTCNNYRLRRMEPMEKIRVYRKGGNTGVRALRSKDTGPSGEVEGRGEGEGMVLEKEHCFFL